MRSQKTKQLDRIAHDMGQYAFTKRKLDCSIEMGSLIKRATRLRKWGIVVWVVVGPFFLFYLYTAMINKMKKIYAEQ